MHHVVGVLRMILDEHTMNSRKPWVTFFNVKDAVPRAACFQFEETFKLPTNYDNFVFSLGKYSGSSLNGGRNSIKTVLDSVLWASLVGSCEIEKSKHIKNAPANSCWNFSGGDNDIVHRQVTLRPRCVRKRCARNSEWLLGNSRADC